MRKIYRQAFAAPLYAMSALLLCFGSCQSSDNAKIGEGASVASLPLTARIGETSSRVGMSDTYGGAFSCYWNGDKFNVYHKYVLSGTVQSMMPLEFSTPATNGITATFSYKGPDAYQYNSGSRLYAFSSGTGGGYTAGVADDGTSTLKATTLASQNGTLADCATYDALYGSANVNSTTGLPESLSMHHLFGMMNLHLTSSTFSTNHPVTVTLASSVANILPDNNGSATLLADGSTLTRTGSWSTAWSVTVTPTTAGVADVYFMTWPFSAINGSFTIWCSDASDYAYTARTVTLSGFSLAPAQLKSKPLAMANVPATNGNYSNLYAWDATDSNPVTLNTQPTNANLSVTASDGVSYASYTCKDCPSADAITWYLSAQYYWDDGNQGPRGGNVTSYPMANGLTTKAGMWFRKKSGIKDFSSTTASTGTIITKSVSLSDMTPSRISDLKLSTDYFFLPAAGYTGGLNGVFNGGGIEGDYWSSTPFSNTTLASSLYFYSTGAILGNYGRSTGFTLWQAQ